MGRDYCCCYYYWVHTYLDWASLCLGEAIVLDPAGESIVQWEDTEAADGTEQTAALAAAVRAGTAALAAGLTLPRTGSAHPFHLRVEMSAVRIYQLC